MEVFTYCCTQCAHLPAPDCEDVVGKTACPACGVGIIKRESKEDRLLREAYQALNRVAPQVRGVIPLQDVLSSVADIKEHFRLKGEAI